MDALFRLAGCAGIQTGETLGHPKLTPGSPLRQAKWDRLIIGGQASQNAYTDIAKPRHPAIIFRRRCTKTTDGFSTCNLPLSQALCLGYFLLSRIDGDAPRA